MVIEVRTLLGVMNMWQGNMVIFDDINLHKMCSGEKILNLPSGDKKRSGSKRWGLQELSVDFIDSFSFLF